VTWADSESKSDCESVRYSKICFFFRADSRWQVLAANVRRWNESYLRPWLLRCFRWNKSKSPPSANSFCNSSGWTLRSSSSEKKLQSGPDKKAKTSAFSSSVNFLVDLLGCDFSVSTARRRSKKELNFSPRTFRECKKLIASSTFSLLISITRSRSRATILISTGAERKKLHSLDVR